MKKLFLLFSIIVLPSLAFCGETDYRHVPNNFEFNYYEKSDYPPNKDEIQTATMLQKQWIEIYIHDVSSGDNKDIECDITCIYNKDGKEFNNKVYTFVMDDTYKKVIDNTDIREALYDHNRKFTEDTTVGDHTYSKDAIERFEKVRLLNPNGPIYFFIDGWYAYEEEYTKAFNNSVEV